MAAVVIGTAVQNGKGAVLIQGPKWCGKTTTAEQVAGSIIYMDEPERKEQNIQEYNGNKR